MIVNGCFAARIARLLHVTSHFSAEGTARTYHVRGQLFFASTTAFAQACDLREKLTRVVLDVTHAHFWDTTSINALDKIVIKFREAGAAVEQVGLNAQSRAIVERLAIYDKPDAGSRARPFSSCLCAEARRHKVPFSNLHPA